MRVAAREARALVDLMAPDETVRSLARSAQMDRDEFRTIDSAKKEEERKQVRDRTVPLIEAMRSDVGLQNKRSRSQRSADTPHGEPKPPYALPTAWGFCDNGAPTRLHAERSLTVAPAPSADLGDRRGADFRSCMFRTLSRGPTGRKRDLGSIGVAS